MIIIIIIILIIINLQSIFQLIVSSTQDQKDTYELLAIFVPKYKYCITHYGPDLLRTQITSTKLRVQTKNLHMLLVGVLRVIYYDCVCNW